MMKTKIYKSTSVIFLITLLIALTTSCVSKKKYNEALDEIARLSVDSTFQEYKITDIKYEKENTIYEQKQENLELLQEQKKSNLKN